MLDDVIPIIIKFEVLESQMNFVCLKQSDMKIKYIVSIQYFLQTPSTICQTDMAMRTVEFIALFGTDVGTDRFWNNLTG